MKINFLYLTIGMLISVNIYGQLDVPPIGSQYKGGVVAYIFQPSDPGYVANQVHGIIAAPKDLERAIQWGNGNAILTNATHTALTTGNTNTGMIVLEQGDAVSYAAKLCSDLELNGFSDWYLPSKDELNMLRLNKFAIGGFSNATYWSSSEYDNGNAWGQILNNTGKQVNIDKLKKCRVRAVRNF